MGTLMQLKGRGNETKTDSSCWADRWLQVATDKTSWSPLRLKKNIAKDSQCIKSSLFIRKWFWREEGTRSAPSFRTDSWWCPSLQKTNTTSLCLTQVLATFYIHEIKFLWICPDLCTRPCFVSCSALLGFFAQQSLLTGGKKKRQRGRAQVAAAQPELLLPTGHETALKQLHTRPPKRTPPRFKNLLNFNTSYTAFSVPWFQSSACITDCLKSQPTRSAHTPPEVSFRKFSCIKQYHQRNTSTNLFAEYPIGLDFSSARSTYSNQLKAYQVRLKCSYCRHNAPQVRNSCYNRYYSIYIWTS